MATPPSAPIIRNAPDALPNTLEFCWFPPASLGSPATITGYRITLQPGNLVYNVPGNFDEFVVSGLTNGQTYQTTIEATNDDGVTYGPSATFRDCQPGSPPPAPPTTVSSFALTTPGTAVVTWTPPAILPDAQIFWYVVTTASSDPTDTIVSTNGWAFMQSNLILSGLNSNSTYYFNVRPVNCPGYGPILSTNTVSWILTTPFSPTQLTGLGFWLDGADATKLYTDTAFTTNVTANGQSVAGWMDKSANGYRFVQLTAGSRPTYTTGSLGGNSVVTFSTSFLNSQSNFPIYSASNGGATFFSVFLTTANEGQKFLMTYQNQTSGVYCGTESEVGYDTGATTGSGNFGFHRGCSDATVAPANTIVSNTATLIASVLDGSSATPNNLTVYKNGTGTSIQQDNNGFYSGTAYPSANSNVSTIIGARWLQGQSLGNLHTGYIADLLWYRQALTPFDRQKVEGYLAWKWGLQANLPTTHPFYTARPTATSVFSPASFSGLSLWLDGADPLATGTAPANGTSITTWTDKSGSGNSATATGTTPTYTSLTSSITFGGAGYYTTNYSASLANESLFVVFRITGANEYQNLMATNGSGGRAFLSQTATTNRLLGISRSVASGTEGPNNSIGTNLTFIGELIVTSGTQTSFVTGGNQGTSVAVTYTAGRTSLIGASDTPAAGFLTGNMYEVLGFNRALSTQDRQTVEGYLAWKWGLQGSLPSTHPYKYNNPAFVSTVTTFSPSQLPSLGLWLDATQITGATNGQALTTWPDRSPNAFTNTGYNGPTYNSSLLNGRPVVQFNGSAVTPQYFDFGNRLNILTTPGISIFSVASYASGTNGTLISKSVYGPGGGRWFLGKDTSAMYFNVPDSITGNNYVNSYADSSTGVKMYSGVWDRANSYNYSNATLCNTVAATDTGGSSNIYSLYVGAYGNTGGTGPQINTPNLMFNGYMGETIVYQTGLTPFDRQKVEGYLAWKWGLQPNLPTTHPFANTPPLSNTVFSPASFSGLQFWLDASQLTGLTNGQALTTWVDKSINAYVGTATGGPTYQTNVTNSLPTVRFNGTSQYVNFGNVLNMGVDSLNIFAVYRQNTSGSPTAVFGKVSYRGNAGRWALTRDPSTQFLFDATGAGVTAGYSDSSTAFQINSGGWDRTTISIFQNGTSAGTASLVNSANLTNTDPLVVGAYPNSSGGFPPQYYMNGDIAELLVYNRALSTQDRQSVEGYLAWKWGLQGNLPLTHPYKFINPAINYTTSMIVPQGLLVRFDATTYSGSGQWVNTGALGTGFNATITAGQTPTKNGAGNAIVFNGSSGWTFPNIGQQTSFTISTWVKRTAVIPLYVAVVSDGTDGTSQMNMAIIGTHESIPIANTDVRGGFYDGSAWRTGSSVTLLSTIWTNVTATFDNTSKNLNTYVNGTLVNTTTYAGLTPNTSSQVYRIGQHIATTLTYFTGEIGQVLIYNRAITATEALQNYNVMSTIYTNPSPPSLVTSGLLVRFDATTYSGSGTWSNIASTGSIYDASVLNGTPVKNTAGNGVVVTNNVEYRFASISQQTVWTMSSWFKRTGTCPTNAAILCEVFGSQRINMCLGINGLSTNNFTGGFYDNIWYNGSTVVPTLNTWVNITATYNGSAIVMYVNGVLSGSVSISVTPQSSGAGYRINVNGTSLVGEIGQILIYNRALTATEVLQNYNATAGTFIV